MRFGILSSGVAGRRCVRRCANAKALAAFIGVTLWQRLPGSSVKGRTMMTYWPYRLATGFVYAGTGSE
jgi:hypothetical protein